MIDYYYETRGHEMVKLSESEFDEILTFCKENNEPYVIHKNHYLGRLVTVWLRLS